MNLWAVLKTVAYTWTQQEVSTEARALLNLGTQLYDRLGVLAGHADDLRRALERTVDSYNRFAGSLESRVLVTARQFPGISATTLDAVPPTITAQSRRFTAAELVEGVSTADDAAAAADASADGASADGTRSDDATDAPALQADVGEIRSRLGAHQAMGAEGWVAE